MNNSDKTFFDYQAEADLAIYNTTIVRKHDRCLVKMFCGSGKSLLMRYCRIAFGVPLVVYVMPSLALIRQFADPNPTEGYLS